MKQIIIVGAGVGGLAAGCFLKSQGIEEFTIIESNKEVPKNLANGVHYLHSETLGLPFEFPLKKIDCVEEIWYPKTDTFLKSANVPHMLEYALKVMGTRLPSSVADPGRRSWETYLPESNDMNDLITEMVNYIGTGHLIYDCRLIKVNSIESTAQIESADRVQEIKYSYLINTAPLDKFLDITSFSLGRELKSVPVFINNYKTENIVPHWLISLYIPDKDFVPYRVTILNNIISMESTKEMTSIDEYKMNNHLGRYFDYIVETGEKYTWKTGRIFGLSSKSREKIKENLSEWNIYLLGRFANWNGKLLIDSTIAQARDITYNIIGNL